MKYKTTLIKKVGSIGILNTPDAHPIMLKEEHIEDKNYLGIVCRPGSDARAGDTVYCIRNTVGSCNQHDSFIVTKYCSDSNRIYPIKDHLLLNGEITKEGCSWGADNFVVLVKADDKEIQEFPCFRRGIESGHVVKFVSPKEGTIVVVGRSGLPPKYTSNTWVEYDNTSVWEPCEDPALSHTPVDPFEAEPGDYVEWTDNSTPTSMTKGQLYKVIKVLSTTALLILNNNNNEDVWSKYRFKRPTKPKSNKSFIDQPASNLRGSFNIDFDAKIIPPSLETIAIDTATSIDAATISIVSVDSMMHKPIQTKQNSKGKQMNSNLFTDILKLLMQTEQTDLEKAPSTYAFFYNNEGEYEGTARVANETEAKKLLQKPEHLGYTMRIYSFSDEFTTQIPVVSTIKKTAVAKTVVAKPARKPRAAKA